MSCGCNTPNWFGCTGFEIAQDDEFIVPEPNEWAGWKSNYGPACSSCDCDGGCECEGSCGSKMAPRIDSRVKSLVGMADAVDYRLAFPQYEYDGGGNTMQSLETLSTSMTSSASVGAGFSASMSTSASVATVTGTFSGLECCCDPVSIEVVDESGKPQTGETLEVVLGSARAPLSTHNVFNVKFKYKKRGSGPSKPCKVKWWEWTDTARAPYRNIIRVGSDDFGPVLGSELVTMPTGTWFDMGKVQTLTNQTLDHDYGKTPCPGEGSFVAKDHPSSTGAIMGGTMGVHITFTGSGEPDCKKQIELRCVQAAGILAPHHMSCFGKDNKGAPQDKPKDPDKAPDWDPLEDRTPYDEAKLRAWRNEMSLGKLRGGLCFVGETPVMTARGLVEIRNICIGDEVATIARATGEPVMRRVIRKDTHEVEQCEMRRIETDSGSIVVVHGSHLVALENGEWTTAARLIPGSRLLGLYGWPVVVGADAGAWAHVVYNIAVADSGNYFVGLQPFMVSDGSGLSISLASRPKQTTADAVTSE